MKSMKWMKAVVVLAVFLGTYALKDFTQFTDNVYADSAHSHGSAIVIEEETEPSAKPADKDEDIKNTVITESEDGDIATVTCGKDTPNSKIEELAKRLEAAGVVKLIVKREKSKKGSDKSKKKKDEEDYELSASDEDDYILAKAWDEVLAMLRGNPMFAKDFDNPDLDESLDERIDDRIERQVEKFVEAYVETTLRRMSKTQPVNLFDEDDESDVYFDWDEQKEFIKDVNEKLSEEFNDLVEKDETEGLTEPERIRQRKLHLQLHSVDKLKEAFNQAIQGAEEFLNGGQGQGDMIDDMFPMMPGMDPWMGSGGYQQKPRTGFGLNIGSTPWGGVTFGVDRQGENSDWGISGGYEHIPQQYPEMFGPMAYGAGGGFGGCFGGGGFNPYANPSDFMGLGGGYPGAYGGYPGAYPGLGLN